MRIEPTSLTRAKSRYWQTLRDTTDDPSIWRALIRLARWASAIGVPPSRVDQAVADRYEVDLAERQAQAHARLPAVQLAQFKDLT
jgi:hypothetical protein